MLRMVIPKLHVFIVLSALTITLFWSLFSRKPQPYQLCSCFCWFWLFFSYYLPAKTYPMTSPVWDIGEVSDVLLNVENSGHYQLNGTKADLEWSSLVPGDGIVYVGSDHQPFMPSVFHQLRCLDVLRQAYVLQVGEEGALGAASRHCLNYLRQMIMCRPNLRLEPVVDPFGPHAVDPWSPLTCKDWRSLYNAFRQNKDAHAAWVESYSSLTISF